MQPARSLVVANIRRVYLLFTSLVLLQLGSLEARRGCNGPPRKSPRGLQGKSLVNIPNPLLRLLPISKWIL